MVASSLASLPLLLLALHFAASASTDISPAAAISAPTASSAFALAASAPTCALAGWPAPSVVAAWRYGGASEKCFCAYAQSKSAADIEPLCPRWAKYVTLDGGVTAGKLADVGSATIQGQLASNATSQRYGSMTDWSADLGSGLGNDCNTTLDAGCESQGVHLLSIPRARYVSDCCTGAKTSLVAMLRGGEAAAVKTILHDMISGALQRGGIAPLVVAGGVRGGGSEEAAAVARQMKGESAAAAAAAVNGVRSCNAENEDPVMANGGCLAQCFHIVPDVNYLHLHTTTNVKIMRDGPIDSGAFGWRREKRRGRRSPISV